MSKLFLVRRGMNTFVGPMTLSEFRADFKRMTFGVQDEITGHCGPWIIMENADRLARYYPEIARVVHDDLQESWRLSDHSARRITGNAKAQTAAKNETRRNVMLAVGFLMIAVGAALAAMYLAGGTAAFSSKSSEGIAGFTVAQANALVTRPDTRDFVVAMQTHQADVVSKHNRTREGALEWIPLLRAYAFLNDGLVDGISPKALRGGNAANAPIDCSEKSWRKRWKENPKTWTAMVSGKSQVRTPWARLLAWDPYWVRRRIPKGWVVPKNYYEGCIQQAFKGFVNLRSDTGVAAEGIDVNGAEYQAIAARLKWLVDVSGGASVGPIAPDQDNILSLWSCYESADSMRNLAQCYEGVKIPESAAAYADERLGAALIRLALKGEADDATLVGELVRRWGKIAGGDTFTRFDYGAELRYLRSLLKVEGLPDPSASEKTPADYADVNFTK